MLIPITGRNCFCITFFLCKFLCMTQIAIGSPSGYAIIEILDVFRSVFSSSRFLIAPDLFQSEAVDFDLGAVLFVSQLATGALKLTFAVSAKIDRIADQVGSNQNPRGEQEDRIEGSNVHIVDRVVNQKIGKANCQRSE